MDHPINQAHDHYVRRVLSGVYPEIPWVPMPAGFKNQAGEIHNLFFGEPAIKSVAVIESVAGAIRSNHWHQTDWHFMYVLSGAFRYFWRDVAGSSLIVNESTFKKGDLMFTPPRVIHATYFTEPTTLIVMSKNIREHDSHESDLVRHQLITVIDRQVKLCE